MAIECQTGNQSTIVFGTDAGFVMRAEIIEGLEETREPLECTGLEDLASKYIPDAVVDRTPLRVVVYWDQAGPYPPITSAAQTVTITFPLKGGEAVAAKLEGTAFLSRRLGPTLQNGEVMRGEYDVMFDGDVGPTYTPGS